MGLNPLFLEIEPFVTRMEDDRGCINRTEVQFRIILVKLPLAVVNRGSEMFSSSRDFIVIRSRFGDLKFKIGILRFRMDDVV